MSTHLLDEWQDLVARAELSDGEWRRAYSQLVGCFFSHIGTVLLPDVVERDMRAAVDSTINARRVSAMDNSRGRWSA